MRNWTVRERAGLAVIVLAVVVAGLGFGVNRYQALTADQALPITALKPPGAGIEVPARGGESASGEVRITEPGKPAAIVVDVQGAVRRPGVYTLREGDRVYKALQAAGGLKPNAAQETLNRAQPLQDGDRVYVAARGPSAASAPSAAPERFPTATPSVRPAGAAASPATRSRRSAAPASPDAAFVRPHSAASGAASEAPAEKSGKLRDPGEGSVNINTADAEELQRLPGIGPAMAERILAHRREFGSFSAPEQLLDVRGIGEKKFAVMEPFVRVK